MFFVKLKTLYRLGVSNLIRVGLYRIGLKYRFHPVLKTKATAPRGVFFNEPREIKHSQAIARQEWAKGSFSFFGRDLIAQAEIPNWFENPLLPGVSAESKKPWFEISDFGSEVGDIKTIWEFSRFDWVIAMSQRASLMDKEELARLNSWLENWLEHNPPYVGVNWKCGQESSIRVMHLALAAFFLGQVKTANPSLQELVKLHLARIAPTIDYAVGQSNNHGTSEAAALFIGGSWLEMFDHAEATKWKNLGRKWLENRSRVLIEDDGSFSQYSVNYHRMMLDTFSFAEVWRTNLGLPRFSKEMNQQVKSAAHWLRQMTDPITGDAPNLGANDGAHILNSSGVNYRDFRASVQLASVLFANKSAYAAAGEYDQALNWLELEKPSDVLKTLKSETFPDGGYHVLRKGNAVAYMRFPCFKFRPSQADALHVDLWVNGKNILRDAGSFSYNSTADDLKYFTGTRSHNTIEFDGRDQMPRLSRFLYGAWLKPLLIGVVDEDKNHSACSASYIDFKGAGHERLVSLKNNEIEVSDHISGKFDKAILRWRLPMEDWLLEGNTLSAGNLSLKTESDKDISRLELVRGYESRFYLEKSSLTVLEVEVSQPCNLITFVSFS